MFSFSTMPPPPLAPFSLFQRVRMTAEWNPAEHFGLDEPFDIVLPDGAVLVNARFERVVIENPSTREKVSLFERGVNVSR